MLSKTFIFHEISLKPPSLRIALWILEEKIAPLFLPQMPSASERLLSVILALKYVPTPMMFQYYFLFNFLSGHL